MAAHDLVPDLPVDQDTWIHNTSLLQSPDEFQSPEDHFSLYEDHSMLLDKANLQQQDFPLGADYGSLVSGFLPTWNGGMDPKDQSTGSKTQGEGSQFTCPGLGDADFTTLCPLLRGETTICSPDYCGANPPCLIDSGSLDIEDCAAGLNAQQPSSEERGSYTETTSMATTRPTTKKRKSSFETARQRKASSRRPAKSQIADEETEDAIIRGKKSHSLVERRYREGLNSGIASLYLALQKAQRFDCNDQQAPQIQSGNPSSGNLAEVKDEPEILEEVEKQRQIMNKVRKSDVLNQATAYVCETEVELRHMADEIESLRERVKQLEKLVRCEDCALVKQLARFNLNFQ